MGIKKFYLRWLALGRRMATFQIKIVFSIAYYVWMVPAGLVFKAAARRYAPGWHDVPKPDQDRLEEALRQF